MCTVRNSTDSAPWALRSILPRIIRRPRSYPVIFSTRYRRNSGASASLPSACRTRPGTSTGRVKSGTRTRTDTDLEGSGGRSSRTLLSGSTKVSPVKHMPHSWVSPPRRTAWAHSCINCSAVASSPDCGRSRAVSPRTSSLSRPTVSASCRAPACWASCAVFSRSTSA